MVTTIFRAMALAALVSLTVSSVHAMSVSPNHVEMTSVGNAGRTQITVTNNGSAPIPVETSLQKLDIDQNGVTKTSPAGEEFLVFPPQAMIPAGGTQLFRLQWVGEPNLDRSRSYMLSVTQIPVKIDKNRNGVQVVSSFGVVVNVAPPNGKPSLRLASTGVAADAQGKRHATITVENASKVHANLENAVIHVSAGTWSKTYESGDILQKIGIGIVQPGKRRVFILPDELPAGASKIQARLDYTPAR